MHISMNLQGVQAAACARNELDVWKICGWDTVHVLHLNKQVVQMLFCNTDSSTADRSFQIVPSFGCCEELILAAVVFHAGPRNITECARASIGSAMELFEAAAHNYNEGVAVRQPVNSGQWIEKDLYFCIFLGVQLRGVLPNVD